MTDDLIIPAHLATERIKSDFKSFLRYAVSICPNARRAAFSGFLLKWLGSLPSGAREELKGSFFGKNSLMPTKRALPKLGGKNPVGLTAMAVGCAVTMMNDFIDHTKGTPWKAGEKSISDSSPLMASSHNSILTGPLLAQTLLRP